MTGVGRLALSAGGACSNPVGFIGWIASVAPQR
jgi:hypothetical protein